MQYRDMHSSSPVHEAAQNFLLDFDLTARRAIGTDTRRYALFQSHFIQGMDPQSCCDKLGMQRFSLAVEIAEIERVVGGGLTERGVFPLASYFEAPVPQRIAA